MADLTQKQKQLTVLYIVQGLIAQVLDNVPENERTDGLQMLTTAERNLYRGVALLESSLSPNEVTDALEHYTDIADYEAFNLTNLLTDDTEID